MREYFKLLAFVVSSFRYFRTKKSRMTKLSAAMTRYSVWMALMEVTRF